MQAKCWSDRALRQTLTPRQCARLRANFAHLARGGQALHTPTLRKCAQKQSVRSAHGKHRPATHTRSCTASRCEGDHSSPGTCYSGHLRVGPGSSCPRNSAACLWIWVCLVPARLPTILSRLVKAAGCGVGIVTVLHVPLLDVARLFQGAFLAGITELGGVCCNWTALWWHCWAASGSAADAARRAHAALPLK